MSLIIETEKNYSMQILSLFCFNYINLGKVWQINSKVIQVKSF